MDDKMSKLCRATQNVMKRTLKHQEDQADKARTRIQENRPRQQDAIQWFNGAMKENHFSRTSFGPKEINCIKCFLKEYTADEVKRLFEFTCNNWAGYRTQNPRFSSIPTLPLMWGMRNTLYHDMVTNQSPGVQSSARMTHSEWTEPEQSKPISLDDAWG